MVSIHLSPDRATCREGPVPGARSMSPQPQGRICHTHSQPKSANGGNTDGGSGHRRHRRVAVRRKPKLEDLRTLPPEPHAAGKARRHVFEHCVHRQCDVALDEMWLRLSNPLDQLRPVNRGIVPSPTTTCPRLKHDSDVAVMRSSVHVGVWRGFDFRRLVEQVGGNTAARTRFRWIHSHLLASPRLSVGTHHDPSRLRFIPALAGDTPYSVWRPVLSSLFHPRPRGGIRVPSTSASAARRFIPALGGTRTNTASSPPSSWLIPARAARRARVRDPEGRATAWLGVVFGVARAPTRTRRLARLRQYDAPAAVRTAGILWKELVVFVLDDGPIRVVIVRCRPEVGTDVEVRRGGIAVVRPLAHDGADNLSDAQVLALLAPSRAPGVDAVDASAGVARHVAGDPRVDGHANTPGVSARGGSARRRRLTGRPASWPVLPAVPAQHARCDFLSDLRAAGDASLGWV